MLNFQRIICIWICCVSCMFGTTQLSTSLVQAVPYEYFDDHDQSFYDLDTEQIQAKYDTRLLSQQMLPTDTKKGFHNNAARLAFNVDAGHKSNVLKGRKQQQQQQQNLYESTAKLKSNDDDSSVAITVDDWLEQEEETATKAASSTSAFTDTLDELHLPRAASCFTNGQKYTHGQKVPRLDSCEVCLCMDGEIFCWWEKCDKKSTETSLTYDGFSTPFEESSTTRMQLNAKTTFKTTIKPMKKPKTSNEDYKYDDDDSAEIREMQQEYEGLKEQLLRDEHEYEQQSIDMHTKKPDRKRNKEMVKKKTYQLQQQQQQQEEEKHKKKIKEQKLNWKQQQQKLQQPQQFKSNEHYEQHHHAHKHNNNNNNNNNRHHDNISKVTNSKILNFPENLPSVLYYDYKTEEHHQHQHQHREQHLKHQKQKQQQHEKELKQRQLQLQLQQEQEQDKLLQQQQTYHHNNRHHEYGQDFHTYNSPEGIELDMVAPNVLNGLSTAFKYFGSGNENIYTEDLQTDSDILPEPPTKKPTFLTSITADIMGLAKTTVTPLTQQYRLPTATATAEAETAAATTTTIAAAEPKEELIKSTTILTPSKKQILSSWDSDKTNVNSNNPSNTNNKSTEDHRMDGEDQDDAFHRWLTSTEINNKNNSSFNETASREEGSANMNGRGFDYSGDERIYENIADDTNAGLLSTVIGHTKQITTKNTEATADSIFADDTKANGLYENEQNNKDNYSKHGNNNEVNNYDSTTFGQIYQNYENNKNQFGSISSGSSGAGNTDGNSNGAGDGDGVISSKASNEDSGVASVVNIDIMLTASSAETQQQKFNFQTNNEQQQQLEQQLQNFEHEKQIAKTHDKFMQLPHLISNTNDAAAVTSAKDNNKRLSILENDNSSKNYNNNYNSTNIVGDNNNNNNNIHLQHMNVNNSKSSNNNIAATNYNNFSSSDNIKLKNSPTFSVSLTNATSATTSTAMATFTASTTTPTLSTTHSTERQCNVMGTLYKIGDVLPQDTGNCLQCICIDGSTSDDTPRVTCSPHNCPPLVLPDLFDATGY